MDRNTVIGIVLIIAIMILWPFYSKMVAPPEPVVSRVDSTQTLRDTGSLKTNPLEDSAQSKLTTEPKSVAPFIPIDTAKTVRLPEKLVSIETDLYSARLSTRGARFLNWTLKKYQTRHGDLVNPIDSTVNFNIAFKLGGRTVQTKDLDWTFESTRPIICEGQDKRELRLRTNIDSIRKISLVYGFKGNAYDVDLSILFEGFGDAIISGEYVVEWKSGLHPVEDRVADEILYQKAYAYLGDEKEEYEVDDQAEVSFTGTTKWIATRNKYFALFIIPQEEDGTMARLSGKSLHKDEHVIDRQYSIGLGMKYAQGKKQNFKIYIGPTDYARLNDYDENLNVIIEWGWAIFRPFTKAIFYTFQFLHGIIPNYGWVIIVFALLVKVLLYPLTHKSYVGMQKMKEVMPRQKALQEKYKGNSTKLQQEMMKLYKEVGYNPISGCLPMIIQIPILFPIYQVFRESIDLRQAPWFGWIKDLSLPDTIYVAHTGLPLIGDFNINPLPIIMTILTFVQQRVAPMTPMGDSTDPAQKFNQKFMMYGMPILFFFLFNNFSSGLVLYWTVFNALTMVQQLYLTPKPKQA